MERRLILAVLLSFLVVTGWSLLTGGRKPPPPTEGEPVTAPGEAPTGPGAPPGPAGAPPAPAPAEGDPDGAPEGATPPPVERVELRNDRLEVAFTSLGAAVESVRLLKAYEADKKTPLDLVVPADPELLLGQVDRTRLSPAGGAPGGADRKEDEAGPLRALPWARDLAAEAATPEQDVFYAFATRSGRTWRKRWVVPAGDRHDVSLEVSVAGAGGKDPVPVRLLASSGLLREPSTWAMFMYPNTPLLRVHPMNEPAGQPFGFEVTDVAGKRVELLGERSHFFLGGVYGREAEDAPRPFTKAWATGEAQDRRDAMKERLRAWFREARGRDPARDEALAGRIDGGVAQMHHVWAVADVPADGTPLAIPFYVGPIDRGILSAGRYAAVEPVIAYPMAFDFIAKGLLWIYDRWLQFLGSAGLAVLLMTLVVRGGLMPLSIRNQLSMRRYGRRVQKLKPKLDALRQRYASNPKKLREEQMKLYREHGVGFPTGCLMILVQLPIFFALFSSLRGEYTLRNEAFGWIPDLSGPDRLVDLPFAIDVPLLGAMMGPIHSLNLLPLVYIALTMWQTSQMPKPMDEQQAQQMRMMKWMPIVFAVLLYNYTAALALYMIVSSLIAVTESRLVRRKDAAEAGAA